MAFEYYSYLCSIFFFKYLILKYFSQFLSVNPEIFAELYKMTFHNGSYRKNRPPLTELLCFTINFDKMYLLVANQ